MTSKPSVSFFLEFICFLKKTKIKNIKSGGPIHQNHKQEKQISYHENNLRDNTYLDYLNKNRSKESEEKETES